jgi:hypothetical protein
VAHLQQPFQNDTVAAQMLINDEIDQPLDMRPLVVASLLAQSDHVETWTGKKPPFGYTDWWPISVYFNCGSGTDQRPQSALGRFVRPQSPAVGGCRLGRRGYD